MTSTNGIMPNRIAPNRIALNRIAPNETTLNRTAHMAGLVYLLVVLVAPYRLVYVPSALFVAGDAAATSANIAAHETLFRLGIAADLACGVAMVFLVLTLYRLLEQVDRHLGGLMVILGGALVPAMYFCNVLNDVAALLLVRGGDFVAAFDQPQRDALAMFFLRLHGAAIGAAELLWGIWLFPLAILVLRSGFLPRLLGYGLMLNGVAYVVQCFAWALLPSYADSVSSIATPFQFVEIVFMLWLLVMGARRGFRANAASVVPVKP